MLGEADAFVRETALTHLARLDGAFPAQALVRLMSRGRNAAAQRRHRDFGYLGERAVDRARRLIADADGIDSRIYALTALELIEARARPNWRSKWR